MPTFISASIGLIVCPKTSNSGKNGTGASAANAAIAEIKGAIRKINLFAFAGTISSFVKSFIMSATICSTPAGPTISGPTRRCMYASTFLSA